MSIRNWLRGPFGAADDKSPPLPTAAADNTPSVRQSDREAKERTTLAAFANASMTVWLVAFGLVLLGVSLSQTGRSQPVVWNIFLVAIGALAAGSLVGFLYSSFGDENERFKPFFNMFNGIVLGGAVTDMAKGANSLIRTYVWSLAKACGYADGIAIISVVIIAFAVVGFFIMYYNRKLLLNPVTVVADRRVRELDERIQQTVAKQAEGTAAEPDLTAARQITPGQIQAAEKVKNLAGQGDDRAIRDRIVELARNYESLRAAMSAGDDRTRKMEVIVTQMRTLGLAAYSMLPDLTKSDRPGDRLAAVAMLQVKPNPDYLDWLADRVATDHPFIGYHAAVALQVAARTLESKHRPAVGQAIAKAKTAFPSDQANTDRFRLLTQVEAELSHE